MSKSGLGSPRRHVLAVWGTDLCYTRSWPEPGTRVMYKSLNRKTTNRQAREKHFHQAATGFDPIHAILTQGSALFSCRLVAECAAFLGLWRNVRTDAQHPTENDES